MQRENDETSETDDDDDEDDEEDFNVEVNIGMVSNVLSIITIFGQKSPTKKFQQPTIF